MIFVIFTQFPTALLKLISLLLNIILFENITIHMRKRYFTQDISSYYNAANREKKYTALLAQS